jgi:hypothetical protein
MGQPLLGETGAATGRGYFREKLRDFRAKTISKKT